MNWTDLLTTEMEAAYGAADRLMGRVDGDLGWKPATGENWMAMGQLLKHMAEACGATCRGFVTGDWGMPEDLDMEKMPADAMLPPAEAMPAIDSVAAAREALARDKALALSMIEAASDRMDEPTTAPWDPRPAPLGQQLLSMVNHLNLHKAQLFYYLKLQGKPVNTMHLFGMA